MKQIICLFFLCLAITCSAQQERTHTGYDPANWFTGGSVSANIGGYNRNFLVGLNPHFGYTIASWIDAAVAANLQYNTARDEFDNRYRNTTTGLGVFTRIYPVKFLFIQVQPEYNLIRARFIPEVPGETIKTNIEAPAVLLGAGYTSSRSGKNSFSYLSILFDVLKDKNSPYISTSNKLIPVIRAGINIGLNRKHAGS